MDQSTLMAQDLNQQAAALIKAGNFEAAKEKIEKAIDVEPMLMDSYKNYGDLCMATGAYKDAKSNYKRALLIEKSGYVHYLYGNACFMDDDPHEGLEQYNLALSAGFDGEDMLLFMGMAYEHLNNDQMALRYFQKASVKNPSRSDIKIKKISVLIRLNLLDDAEAAVDEMVLNDPELFDGYHIKNSLLINQKRWEEAEIFAKSAVDRFPQDPDLYYDYVQVVALKGDLDKAASMLENAKRLTYYEEAKARFVLLEAQVVAEKNELDRAIELCKECIAMEEGDDFFGEARFMCLNLSMVKKDFQSALDMATAMIEQKVQNSYYFAALYYRAFCMKNMDKKEEANTLYQEAVSIYRLATLKNPEAFDAYLYRAMCLKDIEQYEEALELLEFMEGIGADVAEIYTIRADIYKQTGKDALRKEELEKAYRIKPELRAIFAESGE